MWTTLYLVIGLAGWWVWLKRGLWGAPVAFTLFGIQLVLNGLWSWLFFAQQAIGVALLDIALLWAVVLMLVIAFWRQRSGAGVALLAYLVWVSYALALNAAIWRLN